jgi:hypothetical protein
MGSRDEAAAAFSRQRRFQADLWVPADKRIGFRESGIPRIAERLEISGDTVIRSKTAK